MGSDDLISDEDLAAAKAEAQIILAKEPKKYNYLGDYKGGPRNINEQTLMAFAVEIATARLVMEEIQDRLTEANILLGETMQEAVDYGIPIDFIAEHSGLEHRASVYRALRRLPGLKRSRDVVQELTKKLS